MIKMIKILIVPFLFAAVLTSSLFAEEYVPPLLEKNVSSKLVTSADTKVTKTTITKKLMGLRLHELASRQGIYPLVSTERYLGLLKGDVIVAVNGVALKSKPLDQLSAVMKSAKNDPGYLWLTLWRQGKLSRIILDMGSRQLDLTRTLTPGPSHDWRLGPLGANGWVFSKISTEGASRDARQILITRVDEDGPCADSLQVKDVIVGVFGKTFSSDARKALAAAIDRAETEAGKGALQLMVWRKGEVISVKVTLPVIGTYSKTTPFNCPKTEALIDATCDYMMKQPLSNHDRVMGGYWKGWVGYWNALAMMATGRDDVIPKVREFAYGACIPSKDIPVKNPEDYVPGKYLSLEEHTRLVVWDWAFRTIFLSEYYLLTKDEKVIPTIREYATKIAMGQGGGGTWGHTFAARANTGYLHGWLGGYGAINQNTVNAALALVLAQKCGIEHKEISDAIQRSKNHLSYYIGKGTLPYGDHTPILEWFDSNGKSGSAAVFFDLVNNEDGKDFFSTMTFACSATGREAGHGGPFFSHIWGGLGAARAGDRALQSHVAETNFLVTLERQPAGNMVMQDEVGKFGKYSKIADLKTEWDHTGLRLLHWCLPRKVLHLTGKGAVNTELMSEERRQELLSISRISTDKEARAKLTKPEILKMLQDPLPASRTTGIRAMGEQGLKMVPELLKLLDSKSKYARAGAAQALRNNGYNSKDAVTKLVDIVENDPDLLCRMHAVRAFTSSNYKSTDESKGLVGVSKAAIPALLKLATKRSDDDPNQKLQVEIGLALFNMASYKGARGLCVVHGLDEASRPLLVPALKILLQNKNASGRGWVSNWAYKQLNEAELEQLWGEVYLATRYRGPSCIMWGDAVQKDGMDLLVKNRTEQGLELAALFAAGGLRKYDPAKDILSYGSHAKKVIPVLEQHIRELEQKAVEHKEGKVRKKWSKGNIDKKILSEARMIRGLVDKVKALSNKPDIKVIHIDKNLKDPSQPDDK